MTTKKKAAPDCHREAAHHQDQVPVEIFAPRGGWGNPVATSGHPGECIAKVRFDRVDRAAAEIASAMPADVLAPFIGELKRGLRVLKRGDAKRKAQPRLL